MRGPGENICAEPRQRLPQGFVHAIADDRFGRHFGGFIGLPNHAPDEGPCWYRTLQQDEARDAAPSEISVDALDDDGGKMLHFQSEPALDAHN